MAARGIRITSRFAFVICGLAALFNGVPYALLRGVDLPFQSEWVPFVLVLGAVGICSLAAGALRRRWMANVCRVDLEKDPAGDRLYRVPLLSLLALPAIGYLLAVGTYLAPDRWNLNPQVMLVLCPMYFVKMTFDPSLTETLFILAPLNAGVYGAVAVTLAYVRLATRRRTTSEPSS